jgi:hypothetical protein
MSSVWKTLSAIDCSKHVEKKAGLSYLSWAWAWATLMEHYPSSSFEFLPEQNHDDGSVTVTCDVTVEGTTRRMWLPVMDNRNNAIKNPDARKISDARMRCLVKAIAMHGLGLYIYAGEDLPESVADAKVGEAELAELNAGLDETASDKEAFCKLLKVSSLADLPMSQYANAMAMINHKRKKLENDNAKS